MKNLLLASALLMTSLTTSAATVLKFSHIVAENTPKGQTALKFKELLEQRSNGNFSVEIYPNSELYNDNDVLDALMSNDVHFAAPSLSKLEKFSKQFRLFDLPFLFRDMTAVACFESGDAGQTLLHSISSSGVIGLGYLHNGLKQISANAPIHTPADMKGKSFRIMPSDVLAAQFESVGSLPIKKPFNEVYSLLKSKALNGQESTWSNIYSQNLHEVQPYILESNHGLLDYMVVTGKAFWDGLSEQDKKMIQTSMDEAIAYGNSIAESLNTRDRASIVNSGSSEIVTLTEAERQAWLNAMRPIWQQFESDIGADLIQAAQACNPA